MAYARIVSNYYSKAAPMDPVDTGSIHNTVQTINPIFRTKIFYTRDL